LDGKILVAREGGRSDKSGCRPHQTALEVTHWGGERETSKSPHGQGAKEKSADCRQKREKEKTLKRGKPQASKT